MTTTGNLDDLGDSYELWETHIQHLQEDRGITDLWPPQVQAFDQGATDEANFLMVSPPGTGKTLVAELISVNEWVSSGNPTVYLVPYVALAEEKYDEFDQNLGDEMGLEIEKATETEYPNPADLFESQVIVMTYEKFDYYLRNYPDYVGDISCAIVDEFHMISDETRGPNIEVAITDLMTNHPDVRIVGLSATTPNPEAVSDWLGGSFSYSPNWRHNDLHEGICLTQEREIRFYNGGTQTRTEAVGNHFEGTPRPTLFSTSSLQRRTGMTWGKPLSSRRPETIRSGPPLAWPTSLTPGNGPKILDWTERLSKRSRNASRQDRTAGRRKANSRTASIAASDSITLVSHATPNPC